MNSGNINISKKPSVKRRKRRSPEEIKERLLVATKSEFQKEGFGATTAAIAGRADVTEGQLYRYFHSKQDLFRRAVYQPLNNELSDFSKRYLSQVSSITNRKERIKLYISGLQDFIKSHPELVSVLTGSQSSAREDAVQAKELDSLPSYFDLGALLLESREGKNPQIEPKLMVKIIFSTVLSSAMFSDWLFPEDEAGGDEVVEAISNFLISGVYANVPVE